MAAKTPRLKWHTVPGESGFAYLTQGSERVAHIVMTNGAWSGFVTAPKLAGAGSHSTPTAAKRRVLEVLTLVNATDTL